jgi:2-methylisocitrate lyase-like PEP mutase family enzyme
MATTAEKRAAFRKLHESGCFVIPTRGFGQRAIPAEPGIQGAGDDELGVCVVEGRPDNGVSRDMVLAHLREIEATDLPVNADFESGSGRRSGGGESVRLCAETSVAGLDRRSTGNPEEPLFPTEVGVERMKAARAAIDRAGGDVVLVGRAECFIAGRPDLGDAIARLKAYAEAGADCLYAPGIRTREQIEAVVAAVAPKPVNVLVSGATEMSVADYASMGVRRLSVGGGLAVVGWDAVARAATRLADEGSFDGFLQGRPAVHLNALFRKAPSTGVRGRVGATQQ